MFSYGVVHMDEQDMRGTIEEVRIDSWAMFS